MQAPVRKALGVRTVLTSWAFGKPGGATVELMGVYDKSLVEPLARVLANLGVNAVLWYTASIALMKLQLPTKRTYAKLIMVLSQATNSIPKDYGFEYADKTELEGGDATVNAEITRCVLGGEQGGKRTGGFSSTLVWRFTLLKEGLTLAEGIERRKHDRFWQALATMEQFVKATKRYNH